MCEQGLFEMRSCNITSKLPVISSAWKYNKITGMSQYKFRTRWPKTSTLGQFRAIEIQNSTLGQ